MKLEDILKIITLGLPTVIFVYKPVNNIIIKANQNNTDISIGELFNALSPGIIYFLVAAISIIFFQYHTLNKSDAKNKQDLEKENSKLQINVKDLITRLNKCDQKYSRFEKIKTSKINYGFIDYSPYYHVNGSNLAGIGNEVLKSIFEIFNGNDCKFKLNHVQVSSWSEILSGLREMKYDVIATPLYETRTRLFHKSNIAFCLPLFYAEIGLYMSTRGAPKKSLAEVTEQKEHWKFAFIKDEVSQTMMNKFSGQSKGYEVKGQNDIGYIDLLKSVVRSNNSVNIIAMEVFKADKFIKDEKLQLTNILKKKQILYPVSFVVRKEDTTLRNFINLRIIEMLSGRTENELQQIIEGEAKRLGFNAGSIFIHNYEWDNL